MAKRLFDVLFSLVILLVFFWVLIAVWIISIINTKTNGIFTQERIGYRGDFFRIYKFRTMQVLLPSGIVHISVIGKFLRKFKLDELPQLFNVLKGEMSIVGPRPDIPGYYDLLTGENRKILDLKPGLTSLVALVYFDEEHLLLKQENPKKFNDEVLFPKKVSLNLEYLYTHTFFGNLKIICNTIFKITTGNSIKKKYKI
jgi:lipopolysaccharide/colanic/teichoic acid biosynthesis glycosyltransferase